MASKTLPMNSWKQVAPCSPRRKTGLAEAERARTQLPADTTNELRELLRQYHSNFSVLNQMVNKLLDDEHKHGLGRLAKDFRLLFSDGEIDKMRHCLVQCRETARKSTLLFTWALREIHVDTGLCIGYTALAAVLDRPDPTRGVPRQAPVVTTPTETPPEDRRPSVSRQPPADLSVKMSSNIRDPR
jgi:hypothetical protein